MPFRIATRYVDMNILIGRMIPYLETNHERLGVSEEQLTALTAQQSAWQTAYAA